MFEVIHFLVGKGATHILHIKVNSITIYYSQESLVEALIDFLERKSQWKHYKDMLFYSNSSYSTEILDINLFSLMREFALKANKGSTTLDADISYTIKQIQETNYRSFKLKDFIEHDLTT
jgi:hypothetical protein